MSSAHHDSDMFIRHAVIVDGGFKRWELSSSLCQGEFASHACVQEITILAGSRALKAS